MQHDASACSRSEQLALEFLHRVWTPPHELDAIDELMDADYSIVSGGSVVKGREAFKAWVKVFQSRLLEARTENIEVFSNALGDRVVSRWICTGKNNGIFGLPPDGRPVAFTGIAIWRVHNDKLAECWIERSAWELFQELSR